MSVRPLAVGDRVVLDGDAMDDERAERLVEAGFDFHETATVTRVWSLVDGRVLVRLPGGGLVRCAAGELRRRA